jgi:G3E family GTPase
VLSKTDIADASELRARLRRLNPGAPIVAAPHGEVDPTVLLNAGLHGAPGSVPNLRGWLDSDAFSNTAQDDHAMPEALGQAFQSGGWHDAAIHAFCLTFDEPLPSPEVWLERLILTHGDALLRVKGILHLRGHNAPVGIHSIGHLLHPPIPLASWPDGDPRNSRLMFITRDLPRAAVAAGLPESAGVCAT